MDVYPILAAMRRNKVGAILIAAQIAVTLAILCNALFLIEQRIALSKRPTGADEADVFVIDNGWVGQPTDLEARIDGDLAALRSLPGVVDAYVTNSYPLSDGGSTEGVGTDLDPNRALTLAALYFAGPQGIPTLGLKLIAGRNFTPSEVVSMNDYSVPKAPVVIITRQLADKLYPQGDALGKPMSMQFTKGMSTIVGIVDRLQVPWVSANGWGSKFNDNSVLVPFKLVWHGGHYVVRARPGQLAAMMRAGEDKLFAISRARVIDQVRSLPQARADIYRDDRGLAVILGVVCTALLTVTSFGIVGLTSYWVAQRRKQIGIRRALGATRNGVVRYFQTENLLIATTGAIVGGGLAIALNLWMVMSFEMPRLQFGYVIAGALVVVVLGQAAVFWPALRAASVPPALATRAA
ncbi:MAG TPA: FtsX-like permease family protein [Steroidobacteraceae bacterium]|jgi:putative ABC transport system permease protein|nr:FtsX-like permease family protein [Steroidobacteraceae bacterium]